MSPARSGEGTGGGGGPRLLRVGENLRHALSDVLARGQVRDPDLQGVSVTVSEVDVSPDLRHASVFVMPLGGDPEGRVLKALNANSGFFRGQLSSKVRMKYLPRLLFKLDESFQQATSIEALLKTPRVSRDLDAGGGDEGDEGEDGLSQD